MSMDRASLFGQTLGKYQIHEELGRGGMAVVYKAWQPSLERYVALKILPQYFQHDPELLARFHREAKSAARLNHPHIVQVFDTGQVDGVPYIAMEYMESGSLRERIAKGPLGLADAERVVREVGGALDHAHERGLIHRDIKPANILFTPDGRAKVTDFGIARAMDGTQLTRTGMILGTPEYMAPEQAAGEAMDHRADLYALGVVLYQMVTGVAPFRGTTPHATLHAVIYEEPKSPREIVPGLSRPVESVVLKALAKKPGGRFDSGRALAEALARARQGVAVEVPSGARRPIQASKGTPVRLLAGAIGAVMLGLVLLLGRLAVSGEGEQQAAPPEQPATVMVASTPIDEGTRETIERMATEIALEATAQRLDSSSATGTAKDLARERATGTAAALQGTQTAAVTATEMEDRVRQTADAGAAQATLQVTPTAQAGPTETGTPLPQSTAAPSATPTPLPPPTEAPTATPTPVPQPTEAPTATSVPPPPSRGQVVFMSKRDGNCEIYVMNPDGTGLRRLTNHGAVDDEPVWSPNGQLIAFMSERDGPGEIYVMNADGSGLRNLTNHPASDTYPSWSPDGQRIVFESDRSGNQDIWVMNRDGSNPVNLTNHPAKDIQPDWSPDGQRIAFNSNRGGNPDLYIMGTDGGGQAWLAGGSNGEFTPQWSPDGLRIAFMSNRTGDREIYVINANGSGEVRLTNQPGHDYQPYWSPDGNRLVFTSERTGNLEIHAMNADGSGVVRLTNHSDEDSNAVWSW